MHIAFAVLAANNIANIVGIKSSGLCYAVAVSLLFFTLALFSWMTAMCFEVCLSFFCASRLIPVRGESTRCKLIVYFIVAWAAPLLIAAVCVVINYTTVVQSDTNPSWRERVCWITHPLSALVSFTLPVCVFVLLQLMILFVVGGFYLFL